jgi:hypothetical protein
MCVKGVTTSSKIDDFLKLAKNPIDFDAIGRGLIAIKSLTDYFK